MASYDQGFADLVGAIYEAATGEGDWLDVGRRMSGLLDARSAMLYLPDPQSGEVRNLLMPRDSAVEIYESHFRAANPYVSRAGRDFSAARPAHLHRAKVGGELVPDSAFVESEYYVDFARFHQRRHMVGGMVGVGEPTPIGLFRGDDSEPFGQAEVRSLEALLPHFQRALELRARLARDRDSAALTRAALDAVAVGVLLVDLHLNLRFANDLAGRLLSDRGAGLALRPQGPNASNRLRLVAQSRVSADRLERLVASAASGGAGGALNIAADGAAALAVLVSPPPPSLAADVAGEGAPWGLAMITLRPLRPQAAPPAELLCDLFDFTRAEAEVALMLTGGGTAEEVARKRGVSLVTVRSQIRSILGKSESENLRAFERALASLAPFVRDERPLATALKPLERGLVPHGRLSARPPGATEVKRAAYDIPSSRLLRST